MNGGYQILFFSVGVLLVTGNVLRPITTLDGKESDQGQLPGRNPARYTARTTCSSKCALLTLAVTADPSTNVIEGTDVKITCHIGNEVDSRDISYQWSREGQPLSSRAKSNILLLDSITSDQDGLYTCSVAQCLGCARRIEIALRLTIKYAPKWDSIYSSSKVVFGTQGEAMTLTFHLIANPPIERPENLKWNHSSGVRAGITTKSSISHITLAFHLMINSITRLHFGSYYIQAGNEVGESTFKIEMREKAPLLQVKDIDILRTGPIVTVSWPALGDYENIEISYCFGEIQCVTHEITQPGQTHVNLTVDANKRYLYTLRVFDQGRFAFESPKLEARIAGAHFIPTTDSTANDAESLASILAGGGAGGGLVVILIVITVIMIIMRRCRKSKTEDQPQDSGNETAQETEDQPQHSDGSGYDVPDMTDEYEDPTSNGRRPVSHTYASLGVFQKHSTSYLDITDYQRTGSKEYHSRGGEFHRSMTL